MTDEASRGTKSAKPPAFRCVECLRKFPLRNLQGRVPVESPARRDGAQIVAKT
jgi:hypothetical protein